MTEKVDVVALGPGIGGMNCTFEMVQEILPKINKPLILDAEGINAIQDNLKILKKRKFPTVITPHPGEMARLFKTTLPGTLASSPATVQEIQKNRIKYALDLSVHHNVITVLKGARTIIALPDGSIYINPTGNTGLAKGGSGDVLTGLIASFIAQGISAADSTIAGVYIHGLSADCAAESGLDERFIQPTDILNHLNTAFKRIFG